MPQHVVVAFLIAIVTIALASSIGLDRGAWDDMAFRPYLPDALPPDEGRGPYPSPYLHPERY